MKWFKDMKKLSLTGVVDMNGLSECGVVPDLDEGDSEDGDGDGDEDGGDGTNSSKKKKTKTPNTNKTKPGCSIYAVVVQSDMNPATHLHLQCPNAKEVRLAAIPCACWNECAANFSESVCVLCLSCMFRHSVG